jgi:hypothetical protein
MYAATIRARRAKNLSQRLRWRDLFAGFISGVAADEHAKDFTILLNSDRDGTGETVELRIDRAGAEQIAERIRAELTRFSTPAL